MTGVEGEKTRLALKAAGFQAVTNAGGAKQTRFGTALEVLRGRDVVLWPDNDPDGQTWLRTLTAQLTPLVKSLRIVNWADAPPKGDAYDALAAGVDVGALIEEAVMSEEPVVGNLIPTFRRTDAGNVKLLAHLHHEDYVRGAGTADDERRPAVDHRVPDLARLLVAVVTGEENLALERRAQPFDLLVAERAGAAIKAALAQ